MPSPLALPARFRLFWSLFGGLFAFSPAIALEPPVTVGGEIPVNSATALDQLVPAVTVTPGGEFVVAWTSVTSLSNSENVFRRFSTAASPLGGELPLNTYTTDFQFSPALASDDQGRFVGAWDSIGQDGSSYGVFARRFDGLGPLDAEELPVNSHTAGGQLEASVAAAPDGRFVVVWQDASQDGDSYGIFGQRFDADGDSAGNEFQVNTETYDSQRNGSVAMHDDGSFVVVWQSNFQDGEGLGIFGQRFAADGDPVGDELAINDTTSDSQRNPDVAATPGGGFVVVWQSYGQDGDSYGVEARRFDGAGLPIGSELDVNETTSRAQDLPSVAAFEDGSFVVAWRGDRAGQAETDAFARLFDAGGSPVGGEFQVNTTTPDYQAQYQVDVAARGSTFVVTWDGYDDGDGLGIFAQAYRVALFADGFELGNTSKWSATVPPPG